jgi:PAB1-binding protein PBP1
MDILEYNDFLNEMALSPEERKARRKERRNAKKSAPTKSIGNDNIEDIDDDTKSIDFKPSKSMTGSVEKLRTETIKYQDLQKEFVLTPKDNIAKREILKKKLVVQSKIVKRAEAEFEKLVSTEEDDFAQDLFFESFDITEYLLNERLSPGNVKRMEGLVRTKSHKSFIASANEMVQDLLDDGYSFYEAHQFLINVIETEVNFED